MPLQYGAQVIDPAGPGVLSRHTPALVPLRRGRERTIDGVLWIGGDVTESTYPDTPKGTRTAILLKPGSPVQGIFAFQGADPPSGSCQAFFDDMVALGIEPSGLPAIEGTVELAP